MARFLRGLVGLGVFLGAWELACALGALPADYIPPPSVVSTRLALLLTADSDFQLDTIATILACLIATAIATGIAVPLGLLLGSMRGVRVATRALVEFLRPLPSVALIPLVMLLMGGGPETKITLGVYAAVWPILFNTIYSLDEIDPLALDTARSFGFSRARTMFTVALPHAAPFISTGIRVSASITLIVVVTAELIIGGEGGIGGFILKASTGGGEMDLVIAGTFVIGLIGYALNTGLERIQLRLFRWSSTQQEAL
jgi:NitT/TauT family transport system permease protein